MRVLITGGGGYIAKSIHAALKDNYVIVNPNRQELDLTCNHSIKSFFDKHGYFDAVIHTAIKGGSRLNVDDWSVLDTNLSMYYNLCSKERHFNKFINIGSGAEIYSPDTPYGLSKKAIAKSIESKSNKYINLRIFAVFDENELGTRFIKANIKRAINGEPLEVYEDKYMDFFYMEDFIKVIKAVLNCKNHQKEINCVYEKKYKLSEIASTINNLSTHKVPISIAQRQSENYTGDFNLSIPYVGMEKGIEIVYKKMITQQ
jgi:GDP-L-fucose synthase